MSHEEEDTCLSLYLRMAYAISAQTQVLHYTLLSHAVPRVVNNRVLFFLLHQHFTERKFLRKDL